MIYHHCNKGSSLIIPIAFRSSVSPYNISRRTSDRAPVVSMPDRSSTRFKTAGNIIPGCPCPVHTIVWCMWGSSSNTTTIIGPNQKSYTDLHTVKIGYPTNSALIWMVLAYYSVILSNSFGGSAVRIGKDWNCIATLGSYSSIIVSLSYPGSNSCDSSCCRWVDRYVKTTAWCYWVWIGGSFSWLRPWYEWYWLIIMLYCPIPLEVPL